MVRVSAELFHRRGYDGTSIADIAAEMGILPGSVYHYIDAKEDLLYWIVERAHRDLIDRVAMLDLGAGRPARTLWELLRGHVEVAISNLILGSVSQREIDQLNDERRLGIMERRLEYQRTVSELIRRGQGDGSFSPELNADMSAAAVIALANSIYRWYRPEGSWSVAEIAATHATIAVNGLRRRPIDTEG